MTPLTPIDLKNFQVDREYLFGCEGTVRKISDRLGIDEFSNDAKIIWQVAVLVHRRKISEHAAHDSAEAVFQVKPKNKIGYFRICLAEKVGGKKSLAELLGLVVLPRAWPKSAQECQ